jgi:hypothetical protein
LLPYLPSFAAGIAGPTLPLRRRIKPSTSYRRAFARLKRGGPQFGLLNVRKIDGYQGGEAKFVILDMVITDEPGFVADRNRHRNRVNVGLTRCRDGLFLVGDVQASRTIKRSKRGHDLDFLTRRDL